MSRFDFFWYAENNRVLPNTRPAKSVSVELPAGTPLDAALSAARSAGLPKGSPRTGCFEVQCDEGLWRCDDGKRLDRPTAQPHFTTWEDLED